MTKFDLIWSVVVLLETQMAKWLNAKFLIVIIAVAVVGLGVVVWLTRGAAPTAPLPELPSVEVTPVVPQPAGMVRYSLQASLPNVQRLPVYRWERVDTQVDPYARVLGFSGEPEAIEDALEGTLLLWSQEGQTLVVNQDGSGLSYRVDLKSDPSALTGSFLPTFEQAAAIVERTLEEFGSAPGGLEYDPTKNKALKTGVEYVSETTTDQAELVEVHFTAKINDYPLYLQSGPDWDPVLAWVGRDGKLLRLEYHPLGTVGEKIADYPLKNYEEVLQDLNNGKGVVVSSNLEGGEEIISTTITRVTLGYLLPQPDVTVIQPIYVLQGGARTASGKTGTVTIYLGAVGRSF